MNMYVCLRVRCRLFYPISTKMEMYGQTFSTISKYEIKKKNCHTRVDVWPDWHEHKLLFHSLYVFSQKRKGKQTKEWRRSGRQARVDSRDNGIFANVENQGKGRPLPRAVPEIQRRRDVSGDDNHPCVASHRSDGKPLGGSHSDRVYINRWHEILAHCSAWCLARTPGRLSRWAAAGVLPGRRYVT